MSQGRHISAIVKKIVAAVVVENPEASREELIPVIRGRVRAAGKNEPATTTLLKLISQLRKQPASDLDEPWSLASLRDNDLPAECLPVLMQVWRLALSLDQPLTVRQAYWASKLYALFPNPTYLWMWAVAVAIGERSAEMTGQALDTAVLDIVASGCSGWEQRTFALTGADTGQIITSHIPPLSYVSPDGLAYFELLVSRAQSQNSDDDEAQWFHTEFMHLIKELPTLDLIGLTWQAQMVYLRWFSFLTAGPNWSTLSAQIAVDIAVRLREWVLQQQTRIRSAQDQLSRPDADDSAYFNLTAIGGECPEDLLVLVGYPPDHAQRHQGFGIFTNNEHPYLDPA